MKISDLITMCVQNLLRRKVRTLLTVVRRSSGYLRLW